MEAPNGLDRLTYDMDDNRYDGFDDNGCVRTQTAPWSGSQLWAVPASAGEFPVGESGRFTGLDLRGYQQMRLMLNVGGDAGLAGTILNYRFLSPEHCRHSTRRRCRLSLS